MGIPENIIGQNISAFFHYQTHGAGNRPGTYHWLMTLVTKGHNGEMGVISNDMGETLFYITLPI